MTNTQPERYYYPQGGRTDQKIPNQRDIKKLCRNLQRWEARLAVRLITEGAMRPGEVLSLEKDDITEKEESIEVNITEGLGKRNIEISQTLELEKLLKKSFQNDHKKIIPLDLHSLQNRIKRAKERAGDIIPEEISVHLHALTGSGICGLIEVGLSRSEIEEYTGSNNSAFIKGLYEQRKEPGFYKDTWESRREAKTYINEHQEDEELDSLGEIYSKLESRIDQVIEEATGGALEGLEELAGNVAKKEPNTCDSCGYSFDNEEWEWNSAPLDLWEKHSEMPDATAECPECGKLNHTRS